MNSDLILAKQQACKAKGQNFYVTKTGIKRDFNLFGGSYEFKVFFTDGIYVEDSKGRTVEKPAIKKARVSQKLRNTSDEEVSKDVE